MNGGMNMALNHKCKTVRAGGVSKEENSRLLYHGSTEKGLTELKPCVSDHGKAYVYLTDNIVIAAFYTVRPVERPFMWYPYGFMGDVPSYTEYYPEAMADVYKGKSGYIYECESPAETVNPTHIKCAYLSAETVKVHSVMVINDMYEWIAECEKSGEVIIQRYKDLSPGQLEFAHNMVKNEIIKYELKNKPESGYTRFLKEKFAEVWNSI